MQRIADRTDIRMEAEMEESSRNPYLRANSLAELLSWNDVNFVRCAYVTLLGRQPDRGGELHYTRRVRSGHSKLDILWEIRRSAEARRHDPGISGFDRALRKAAWSRKPIIGPFVRLLAGGEYDDRFARMNRATLNELGLVKDLLGYSDPAVDWSAPPVESNERSPIRDRSRAVRRPDGRAEPSKPHLPPSATKAFQILIGESSR